MVTANQPRLTRDEWLTRALDVLAWEGSASISLNNLIAKFHVTKGSFYWHFRDQDEFHRALIQYWHEVYTVSVGRDIEKISADPAEQLKALMKKVVSEEQARFDNVVASLASQNPELGPEVQVSYKYRQNFVRKRYLAMGFRGKELSTRTRMFVASMMSEPMINAGLSLKQRVAQIPANLGFLIGPR